MAGDRCIREDVLGLTFRISPHAFFQVAGVWAQEGEGVVAVEQSIWGEPRPTGGVCGACCCGARRACAWEEAGCSSTD